jgi:hypothetical protein
MVLRPAAMAAGSGRSGQAGGLGGGMRWVGEGGEGRVRGRVESVEGFLVLGGFESEGSRCWAGGSRLEQKRRLSSCGDDAASQAKPVSDKRRGCSSARGESPHGWRSLWDATLQTHEHRRVVQILKVNAYCTLSS